MKTEEKISSKTCTFKALMSCFSTRWATPPMRPNIYRLQLLTLQPHPPELRVGQSHIKGAEAPATAHGKDAITQTPTWDLR